MSGLPPHPAHPGAYSQYGSPPGWTPTWYPTPPGYAGYPGWLPYPLPPHPTLPYLAKTIDRVVAYVIDAVLLLIVMLAFYALALVTFFGFVEPKTPFFVAPLVMLPMALLPTLIQAGYFVFTEGRTGQTLGKRLVGIRVVKVDGRPIVWHDALVRWLCLVVDTQLFVLGLILIVTRPLKQRVGDLAARTVVVRT